MYQTKLVALFFSLVVLGAATTLPTQDIFANVSKTCPGVPFCNNAFTFNAQQFDPSLGTLLSVDFSFFDIETANWSLFGTSLTSGLLTVQSTASTTDLPLSVSQSSSYPVSPPCSPTSCRGTATNDLSISGSTLSSLFVGTGIVALDFNGNAQITGFSGSGTVSSHVDSMQDVAELKLTYNYQPVPEANSFWLVALAGLMIFASRQRTKAG